MKPARVFAGIFLLGAFAHGSIGVLVSKAAIVEQGMLLAFIGIGCAILSLHEK